MSVEENKAAVRSLSEVITKRNFSKFSELFTPNYVFHSAPDVKGPEGVTQTFTTLTAAFPDYQEKIERMVAEGDLVAVFYTMSGTFKNTFGGVAPTGKKFSIPSAVLSRFENGKQVEAWPYYDNSEWARQLGVPVSAE